MNTAKVILTGAALSVFSVLAHAVPISADFRLEADLPDLSDSGAKVYEALDQEVTSGYELTGDSFLENPSDWLGGEVWMNLDPTTYQLKFNSQDNLDFQIMEAWVTNIQFDASEMISGVSLVSNDLTDPLVSPEWSFTSNSLYFSFDASPGFFDFTGGDAVFQIETRQASAAVPEPGTLSLFALGLLMLVVARSRRQGV